MSDNCVNDEEKQGRERKRVSSGGQLGDCIGWHGSTSLRKSLGPVSWRKWEWKLWSSWGEDFSGSWLPGTNVLRHMQERQGVSMAGEGRKQPWGSGRSRVGFEGCWVERQLLKVLVKEIMSHELWKWLRTIPREAVWEAESSMTGVLPSARSEHRGLSRSGWVLEMFGVRSLGCRIAQTCVRDRQEAKWTSSIRARITRHVCYNDLRYHQKLCSNGGHLMLKHHSHKQLQKYERAAGA